jgi:hypothetical protein
MQRIGKQRPIPTVISMEGKLYQHHFSPQCPFYRTGVLTSICSSMNRPFLHERNGEAILFSVESFADLRMRPVRVNAQNAAICFDPNPIAASGPQEPELGLTAKIDLGASDRSVKNDDSRTHSVFIEDLYFVTKEGALESVHSKALCWVLSKISCETQFDHDLLDIDAVEDLRLRVEVKHPQLMSTYDLLSMYSDNQVTEQLFIVSERKKL